MIRSIVVLCLLFFVLCPSAVAQDKKAKKKENSKKTERAEKKKAATKIVQEDEVEESDQLLKKNKKKYKQSSRKKSKPEYEKTISPEDISWTSIQKKKSSSLANQVVAQDQTGYFTWQGYDGYYYDQSPVLRFFDHNGNQKISNELGGNYIKIIPFNNKLYFVSHEAVGEYTEIQFQEINKKNCSLVGGPIPVFKIPYSKKQLFNPADFEYRFSPDKKQLIIAIRESKAKGKKVVNNLVSLVVLNTKLRTVWSEARKNLFKSKPFHLLDFEMDRDDNVILACQVFITDRLDEGSTFELVTLSENAQRKEQVSLEFWNLSLVDMELSLTADNRILGVALYNTTANSSRVKGVIMVELDTYHNEIKTLYVDDLPLSIISNMLDQKKISDVKEIDQLYLDKVIAEPDGSFTLFAQRSNRTPLYGRYANSRSQSIDDTSPESRSYGNLLVVRMSGNGKMEWAKVINKNLSTSFSQYRMGDFSAFVMNGKTRIFYYKGRFASRGKPILMTTIDASGRLTHEKLIKSRQAKLFVCPRWFHISEKDGSLMMYGQMTSRFRYGKVFLK